MLRLRRRTSGIRLSATEPTRERDEGRLEQEEDKPEGPLELPTQTVTGSRLQTSPAASPVYVLSRDEIDRRGLKNMEDIVRYLPQNFPTILSGGSFDARSPRFSQGTVTINLRGLGEGSTLVLVNGKRIAASPAERGTFTDVSTIPFSAIDRVEMITDGASAIYGSDAVGGVVNFILKQNYRGAESSLRYENSSSGGDLRVFEQTLGFSWETGNLTASFNFSEEDPVFSGDAKLDIDWDYREQGGRFFPATRGQPGIITRFGQFPPGAPPNSGMRSCQREMAPILTVPGLFTYLTRSGSPAPETSTCFRPTLPPAPPRRQRRLRNIWPAT